MNIPEVLKQMAYEVAEQQFNLLDDSAVKELFKSLGLPELPLKELAEDNELAHIIYEFRRYKQKAIF